MARCTHALRAPAEGTPAKALTSSQPHATTGTHDNQTVLGWYKAGCRPEEARLIARYIGAEAGQDISWAFIREAFKSVARTVVVAMQVHGGAAVRRKGGF